MCVTILGESDLVISVLPGAVEDNLPLREFYRQEMNWQIVHDSLHAREGWDSQYGLALARSARALRALHDGL